MVIEFENLDKAFENLVKDERREVMRDIKKRLPSAIRNTLNSSQATGKLYPRRSGEGFKRFHRASAKGQPPANDSFELYRSIRAEMSGDDDVMLYFAEHAKYMEKEIFSEEEFGGYLNRPFIMPSLDTIL